MTKAGNKKATGVSNQQLWVCASSEALPSAGAHLPLSRSEKRGLRSAEGTSVGFLSLVVGFFTAGFFIADSVLFPLMTGKFRA